MKLITIQTMSAYNNLLKNGYLVTDAQFINTDKYGVPYNYIINKMQHIKNPYKAQYPLWAWVKYGKISSPRKNKLLGFFAKDEDVIVKITFTKPDNQVLITDYIKYHFLLTNEYLPLSIDDKKQFDVLMKSKNVTSQDLLAYVRRDKFAEYRKDKDFKDIISKIENSYNRIFENLGSYQQGTIWHLNKAEILKVEFIHKNNCTKKSSVDYRKKYLKALKKDQ